MTDNRRRFAISELSQRQGSSLQRIADESSLSSEIQRVRSAPDLLGHRIHRRISHNSCPQDEQNRDAMDEDHQSLILNDTNDTSDKCDVTNLQNLYCDSVVEKQQNLISEPEEQDRKCRKESTVYNHYCNEKFERNYLSEPIYNTINVFGKSATLVTADAKRSLCNLITPRGKSIFQDPIQSVTPPAPLSLKYSGPPLLPLFNFHSFRGQEHSNHQVCHRRPVQHNKRNIFLYTDPLIRNHIANTPPVTPSHSESYTGDHLSNKTPSPVDEVAEPSRVRLMMKLGVGSRERSNPGSTPYQTLQNVPAHHSHNRGQKGDFSSRGALTSCPNYDPPEAFLFLEEGTMLSVPHRSYSSSSIGVCSDEQLMLRGHIGVIDCEDGGTSEEEKAINCQSSYAIGASPKKDITTGYYPQDSSSIEFDLEYHRHKEQQPIGLNEQQQGFPNDAIITGRKQLSNRKFEEPFSEKYSKNRKENNLNKSFFRSPGLKHSPSTSITSMPESMEFRLSLVDLKSREDFRVNYLKKLSYANVWIPQARRPPQHQTVSIFDWDDTLLCTSYINLRGDDIACSTISKQLAAIEHHAKNLLTTAMKMGRVFVITNAMHGWVEYSARKYLPGLLRTLQSISVISARHRFEGAFPGDYQRWKIQAFLEVQRTLNSKIITNLVSVGDSTIEMDAVHIMGREFSQALVKTVKFRENPSPDELAKQLELVSQKFEKICLNAKNLKIGLERRVIHPRQRISPKTPNQRRIPSDNISSTASTVTSKITSNAIGLSASSFGNLQIQKAFQLQSQQQNQLE